MAWIMEVRYFIHMGQIITVFGSPGSGKSTVAANLASALASLDKVVMIVGAELNYGSIQTFFSTKIEKEKGTFAALADQSEQPEKYLTQTEAEKNIYLLAAPNNTFEVFTGELEVTVVARIFRKLSIASDYLIIDATSDLYNGLTLMGLRDADYVITVQRATVTCALWHQSMLPLIRQLSDGTVIETVADYLAGIHVFEYTDTAGIDDPILLSDVPEAVYYEIIGKPVYQQSKMSKQHNKYAQAIDVIIQRIYSSGKVV